MDINISNHVDAKAAALIAYLERALLSIVDVVTSPNPAIDNF